MTRINTNVSSLIGRNNLANANDKLNTSLTRLSTGLRINTGADDPAGLIASEKLRSDITSIEAAITNTDRANQVIATADSALSEVSSLLNDIRGLITESANSGALSDDQIAANQLQIDSSLDAINRIAQNTSFQGNNLLDGSLDFTTTAGANFSNVSDLNIDQANLGSSGSVAVEIGVTTAATQATVAVAGTNATAASGVITGTFTADASGADGEIDIAGDTLTIDTVDRTAASLDGSYTINIIDSAGGGATVGGAGTNINIDLGGATLTSATLATLIATDARFDTATSDGTAGVTIADTGASGALTGSQRADADDVITVTTANSTDDFDATAITFTASTTIGNDTAVATYNSTTDQIEVELNGQATYTEIATAISALDDFTAAATTGTGELNSNAGTLAAVASVNTTAGNAGGFVTEDVVFEISGSDGAEVFTVAAGTSIQQLADQVNLVSDATGVTATASTTAVGAATLTLNSSEYGTDSLVDLRIVSEGSGTTPSGTFTSAVSSGSRDLGADIVATVNGIAASGDGNSLSINTSTLDLNLTLAAGFSSTANFTITGGGALFQLGPDVVSNQQARLGIGSVNTAQLGGTSGSLYQLAAGQTADLDSDATTAAKIVTEAIDSVTSLRGRLGAFQATTLKSNKSALGSTIINLRDAESQIRDADFAAETANLTRSQILVQSGTQVLSIANQNPQNVLGLLG